MHIDATFSNSIVPMALTIWDQSNHRWPFVYSEFLYWCTFPCGKAFAAQAKWFGLPHSPPTWCCWSCWHAALRFQVLLMAFATIWHRNGTNWKIAKFGLTQPRRYSFRLDRDSERCWHCPVIINSIITATVMHCWPAALIVWPVFWLDLWYFRYLGE